MAFSHTESISGTEHMKNSEPKSCDPYVDSLIRNADAKGSRGISQNIEALTIPYRYHRCILFWVSFSRLLSGRVKPF